MHDSTGRIANQTPTKKTTTNLPSVTYNTQLHPNASNQKSDIIHTEQKATKMKNEKSVKKENFLKRIFGKKTKNDKSS